MLQNKTNLKKKVHINYENSNLEKKVTKKNGSALIEIRIIICLKLIKHSNKNLLMNFYEIK